MSGISRTDTVFANQVFIPTGTYRVCCTKAELGKSRKGNPMITLTSEIIEPETVEHNGKEIRITGQTFQLYLTLVPGLVGKQKESNMAQVWKFCDKTGVTELMPRDDNGEPVFEAVDSQVPADREKAQEYFLGLEWDMPLTSKERIKRARQTPEQKAQGLPGEPILDGEGNPQKDGWEIEASINDVDYNCRPSRRDIPY